MLFNSLRFLIFFPLVTAAYFLLPHRVRWLLLLAASVYFYMVFKPVYILILAFTILVDYTAGILIESAEGRTRRMWLLASILANTGSLVFFKYYNFLNDSLINALGVFGLHDPIPLLDIILPIGLSFHVFQSLSYTIEVYRGNEKAERHPGIFALYVMFYPQLVAGPIERPQNLLWQFRVRHTFEYERVKAGLQLMLWGFAKKVLIADRLSPFVNQVYDHSHEYRAISYVAATVFFAFQIYCDFSGYSDIALGSAQVMGFTLMKNFNRPYFSRSISEFWKCWHISLSTWFRDYLYVSMGGNRVSRPRWYFNLFFTFLVSGLWHGANWTYVIWGAVNGFYLVAEILWKRALQRIGWARSRPLAPWYVDLGKIAFTFVLTCLAWVFFRAATIADAFHILGTIFSPAGRLLPDLLHCVPIPANSHFLHVYVLMGQGFADCVLALSGIVLLLSVEYFQTRIGSVRACLDRQPAALRWGLYYATVCSLLFFGAFSQSQQFIYFQF